MTPLPAPTPLPAFLPTRRGRPIGLQDITLATAPELRLDDATLAAIKAKLLVVQIAAAPLRRVKRERRA